MATLVTVQNVFIKQALEWIEIVSSYEVANRYFIYTKNQNDPGYTMLFYGKETSTCCERNCTCESSQPMQMLIKHASKPNFDHDFTNDTFAVFNKPYTASFFCCCRPESTGHYRSIEGSRFGKLYQPYTCCNPAYQVRNNQGHVIYTISTSCCTCGYLCGNCCGFDRVVFYIFKGTSFNLNDTQSAVGRIIKHAMGWNTFITDSDNMEIDFPIDATPEEKLNLIGTALLIDYTCFLEDDSNHS